MITTDLPIYNEPPRRSITFQPRIIAGVLFSISKSLFGEIYPVYMGYNSIGRAEESDIRLQEETISYQHGHIRVFRDDVTGEFSASFSDTGSQGGSSVNGSDAQYETVVLNDGDTLDLGDHYRFLFRIFNSCNLPLFENSDFKDVSQPENEKEKEIPGTQLNNLNSPLDMDFYAPTGKSNGNDRTILA